MKFRVIRKKKIKIKAKGLKAWRKNVSAQEWNRNRSKLKGAGNSEKQRIELEKENLNLLVLLFKNIIYNNFIRFKM